MQLVGIMGKESKQLLKEQQLQKYFNHKLIKTVFKTSAHFKLQDNRENERMAWGT